ncbi:MAG: insulinase family protein [Candidatus Omnitrophica bacterium]|nr:insulinase family protein [Candidatus Omnitrophota bacterium]
MHKRTIKLILPIIFTATLLIPISLSIGFTEELPTYRERLDNGLVVIVREDHKTDLVSIDIRIKTGSAREGEFVGTGISHFGEHMIFKGTETRSRRQIGDLIKGLGGYFNGFTSHDFTGFVISLPSENLDKGLELLSDILMNPSFDEEQLKREGEVILDELRLGEDDPSKKLMKSLWAEVFRVHAYGYPVIGHADLFEELTRDDLIKYHKAKYVPENMVLSIAGDVDIEEAILMTKKNFGVIPRGRLVHQEEPQEPLQIGQRRVEARADTELARLAFGFRSTSIFDKDLYAMDILTNILGRGEESRLYKRLFRERELVYGIGSFNYTPRSPGIFVINATLKPENLPQTETAILEVIEEVKDKGVTDGEMARAKKMMEVDYIRSHKTIESQASDLAMSEALINNYNFYDKYLEEIKMVSVEDVKRVAKKYLRQGSLTTAILLPDNFSKEVIAKEGKKVPRPQVERIELPKGAKLLIREDASLPLIHLRATFLGGLRVEDAGVNGISSLVARMLLRGTKKRTGEEIAELIESKGGQIASFSGNNSFGIYIELPSSEKEVGMDLLDEILNECTFPEDEILKEKTRQEAALKAQYESTFKNGHIKLNEALFGDHPYGRNIYGKKAILDAITRDDLQDFYNRYCVSDNTILAAFGDLNSNVVAGRFKRIAKKMNSGYRRELPGPAEAKMLKRVDEISYQLPRGEAIAMLGFLGTRIDSDDRYALSIANSVLSGTDGRLFNDVRDKLGITYTLGCTHTPGIERGSCLFYVSSSPDEIARAKGLVKNQIKLLLEEGLKEGELEMAKADIIGSHKRSLQTNDSLSLQVSLDELYGLGYDAYLHFEEKINGVNRDSVIEVAGKYFDLKHYVDLVINSEFEGRDN